VDLTASDLGAPLVEQASYRPHQPGLALSALAEQHQIVTSKNRTLQLGKHGEIEADDAGECRSPGPKALQQIVA
jgi:hypothetical protein